MDVARRAGVSQSSVSRAFSRHQTESGVADETRARIFKAAKELGFRPNAIARTLITNQSRIIALLFSYLDNPFYALALEKLCLELQRKGYHALVFMMPDTIAEVDQTMNELLDYQVDGIITASVELSSNLIDRCDAQGIPVVMFNRTGSVSTASAVTTDNINGAREVAQYLIAGGHRRIAMLGGWEEASTNRDREFGFRAELAASGVELFAYAHGDFHIERATEAARALFGMPALDRPDAVFVTNDYMAFPTLSVLRYELGLSLPNDVSVIGFDDVPRAAAPEYDLTTYRQPLNKMVELAVEQVIAAVNNSAFEPQKLALTGRLVERGSARRPA